MAFSLGAFPNETILVECRALVFVCNNDQWKPVRDGGVYSKVQLLCQTTANASGTSGLYRFYGRLETSGYGTLDVVLQPAIQYIENEPMWHLIRNGKTTYGLRISPDSNAARFALVAQNTIRSMQVGPRIPPPPPPVEAWTKQASMPGLDNGNFTPFSPGPAPVHRYPLEAPIQRPVQRYSPTPVRRPVQRHPFETPIQQLVQQYPPEARRESSQVQTKRLAEQYIEQLCNSLSNAIQSGDQATGMEMSKRLSQQKVALNIKQKNPTHVPVDPGIDSLSLRVIVEDKEYSGGAFTMKVAPTRKIQDLQREVFDRYGFPVQVQKWIVGQRISKPNETLRECGIRPPGATVFLYLVSGATARLKKTEALRRLPVRTENPSAAATTTTAAAPTPARTAGGNVGMARTTSMPVLNAVPSSGERESSGPLPTQTPSSSAGGILRDLRINDVHAMIRSQGFGGGQERQEHHDVNSQMQMHTTPLVTNVSPREAQTSAMTGSEERLSIPVETNEPEGWQCPKCTLINVPTRPGCEVCSAERPAEYVVPDFVNVDDREHARIEEEQRQRDLFEEAEDMRQIEATRERDRNLAALMQTAQQNIVSNTEEFECVICFSTVETGDGVLLRECLHSFCKDCLREHIRNATDPEVQCPYQDGDLACHEKITAQEIRALLSQEDFNKFLNQSLVTAESQAANSFHCKTANCPGWCLYEDNVNQFLCPVCDVINCLTCKAIHHPEMNCKEYQDDLQRRAQNDDAARETQRYLDGMIASGDAMNCPQCKVILLKKDGCDWMRCSMCKLEICWATRGHRWGPRGVGDVSGGCRCRVGGKRCHPNCKNCH